MEKYRQKIQEYYPGRVILHCDCNSFYASVELLRYPELRDKPVAVSGSVDDRHGIILAKNEAAKKYNIQTAETVWQAKRKCPDLILLSPTRGKYSEFSKIINTIYSEYTDMVEPFGIDESWLDVTGSWHLFADTPHQLAHTLRERVKAETGLTLSIGVSFNKIFAKIGSDYKKPDAVTEIHRQNYKEIVWPMPVSALLYVGSRARQTLAELNIQTIGQLAAADPQLLSQVLGKAGGQLSRYARGEDQSPVAKIGEREPVKSVGNGLTFRRNLVGYKDIRTGITGLSEEVAVRLRRHKLFAQSVQVQIKDPDLKSIQRQKTLSFSTNLAKDISKAAMELVQDNWDMAKPVRMLTVTAGSLSELPTAAQTSFFDDAPTGPSEKRQRLEESLDSIRDKYGWTSVLGGGLLHNDIGMESAARPEEEETEE